VNATEISLTVSTGRATGTGPSRRIRVEGQVPAVVYGLSRDPVSVTVPWADLRRVLSTEAGQNALIQLDIDGERSLCMVTDLQRHPVRREVIHVDFLRIDPDKPLSVDIPIALHGVAAAVEQRKGMIDQLMYTLTVQARPDEIPSQVDADISHLEIGTTLNVGDLELPNGVSTNVDPATVVAAGSPTRSTIILQQEEARAERIASGTGTEEDLAGAPIDDAGGD
jgi:large subunit ribosomal protein L25